MQNTVKKYRKIDFLLLSNFVSKKIKILFVFWPPEDDPYTGSCELIISIYRRARSRPVAPGFASQADPIPSLVLTRRYSGRQSLGKPNSLKLTTNYYCITVSLLMFF